MAMSESTQYAILFLCIFIPVIIWITRKRSFRNLPPGPRGWPVIGILPQIVFTDDRKDTLQHQFITDLSHKYGKVFSYKYGSKSAVVLTDLESVREAFNNAHNTDRPDNNITDLVTEGFLLTSGVVWREHRKFFVTNLRKVGSYENQVTTEASFLVAAVFGKNSQPFDPYILLRNATTNVVSSLVLGKRYEYDDKEFNDLIEEMETHSHLGGRSGSGGIFLPKFIARLFMAKTVQVLVANWKSMLHRFQTVIDQRKEKGTASNTESDQCIIDDYLLEMSRRDEQYLKSASFNLETLKADILDMFRAGMHTSSTTLSWALLYLVTYPELQKKLQHDLDNVVGRDRLPTLADKPKLPFVEATLLEVLRIRTPVPLGGSHIASCDTTIKGFDIPKGTIIFSNIWGINNDPDLWKEPHEFKPERYFDHDGNVVVPDHFIPFSIGRRVCIGEKIAKSELFVFFSHLLHKFSFTIPEGSEPPSFKGVSNLTYTPDPFKICAVPRN